MRIEINIIKSIQTEESGNTGNKYTRYTEIYLVIAAAHEGITSGMVFKVFRIGPVNFYKPTAYVLGIMGELWGEPFEFGIQYKI